MKLIAAIFFSMILLQSSAFAYSKAGNRKHSVRQTHSMAAKKAKAKKAHRVSYKKTHKGKVVKSYAAVKHKNPKYAVGQPQRKMSSTSVIPAAAMHNSDTLVDNAIAHLGGYDANHIGPADGVNVAELDYQAYEEVADGAVTQVRRDRTRMVGKDPVVNNRY